jgi:uncharacterized membrane protein YfbV (UPF0208 family)
VNNGKATWVAIIGIMLTMAGVIWRGGNTVGQIEQRDENQAQAIQQLQNRVKTITDVLVKQARGKAKREDLQRQINRLEDQLEQMRQTQNSVDPGPHPQHGSDSDGGPRQQSAEKR